MEFTIELLKDGKVVDSRKESNPLLARSIFDEATELVINHHPDFLVDDVYLSCDGEPVARFSLE